MTDSELAARTRQTIDAAMVRLAADLRALLPDVADTQHDMPNRSFADATLALTALYRNPSASLVNRFGQEVKDYPKMA